MRNVPRTPLLYIVLGFLGGIIVARNAAPMNAPSKGAVFLAMLVGGYILWKAGYKGKREAVASAVAIATATARAEATANAQAAINLYMNGEKSSTESLKVLDSVTDTSIIEEQAQAKEIQNGHQLPDNQRVRPERRKARTLR